MGKEGSELKSKKKVSVWVYIIIAAVLVTVIALTVMIISGATPEKRAAAKLERAERYMTALEYEEAIVLYKEALEIDPKNIEAYKGLFNAYIKCEEEDEAADVLEEMEELLEDLEGSEKKSLAKAIEKMRAKLGLPAESEDDKSSAKGEKKEETEPELKEVKVYKLNGFLDYVETFDSDNKLVKKTVYNNAEGIRYYDIYEYDINGRLVKITGYYPDGNVYDWEIHDYGDNGKCVRTVYYATDGTVKHVEVYEYAEEGYRNKVIDCFADGTIDKIKLYDSRGLLQRKTYYSDKNEPMNYIEYEYDADNKLVKEINHYAEDSWGVTKYKYDASGNCIEEDSIYYFNDGFEIDEDSERIYYWKYDEKGNVLEERRWGLGSYVKTYKYDDRGILIGDESNSQYDVYEESEYDINGNCVKTSTYYTDYETGEQYFDGWEETEYELKGRTKRSVIYRPDGSVNTINEYSYGRKGFRQIIYYQDGSIYSDRESYIDGDYN